MSPEGPVHLPIVLIGPQAAGKSTLAAAVAKARGLRHVPLDAVRYYYFLLEGFEFARQLAAPDFATVAAYWKPFEIGAAEGVLADFPDSVIDFGASQAHFEQPDRRARFEAALGPLPNVFLLLPSLDLEEAIRICDERDRARMGPRYDPMRGELARKYVHSDCFRAVAKHTVVTGGRSVEEAAEELLSLLT